MQAGWARACSNPSRDVSNPEPRLAICLFSPMKNSPAADVHRLDHPIWSPLSSEQAYLAQTNALARRFPDDIAPFGAMAGQSAAEYQALAEILAGDTAALFLDAPPTL